MSDADQKVYNHAVRTGNANVARHHEIVNNKMNKLSLYMQGKPVTGLSQYDIRQAEYLFNSEGEREYQSINEAIEAGKVREKPETGKKDDKDKKGDKGKKGVKSASEALESMKKELEKKKDSQKGPTEKETLAEREALSNIEAGI